MAHVQKKGDRWQARFRDPAGREHAKRFDRRADAERWLRDQGGAVDKGQWIDPSLGRLAFDEWTTRWWASTPALRPSTRARDASYLRNHILTAFGGTPLAAIDHLMVMAWVAELSAAGKAPATVAKCFQILSKIVAAAVDARLIPASPCTKVKLPKIEREEMRFLNPTEVGRLADAIDPRYRALVLVGAFGGLRIGELAGLKPARVDFMRRRVDVREILVDVNGHLSWGAPKTRAGRRSVSLPAPVMDELAAHMEAWPGRETVFAGPEGGPLRVGTWRRRFWRPAVEAAGVAPLRVHDLRHTAVSLWIANGANPKQVATRAGHSSVSTSFDLYGHLFPDADDELMERMARLVVPPTPEATVSPIRKAE